MPDFSKKQKSTFFPKKYLMILTCIGLLLLSFFLLVANVKLYKKQKELSRDMAVYQKDVQIMKGNNVDLKEKIANYDNPEYIEKVAREEANMRKPGEQVVSFIEPDKKVEIKSQQEPFWSAGFWQSILDKLESIF